MLAPAPVLKPAAHDEPSPARADRLLLAALALAALLQVILALRSSAVCNDAPNFVAIARALQSDPIAAIRARDQHPGYSALLLPAHWLCERVANLAGADAWIAAGRLISGLFGLLTVFAVWLLTRRLFGRPLAGMAAVMTAVVPLLRQSAADVQSDTAHLFFYLFAAWLLLEGLQRWRWGWFAGAGVASAVAYWFRPEGFSVAIVGAGVLAILAARRRSLRALAMLGVLVLAAAAVAAPYWCVKGAFTSKKDLRALADISPEETEPPNVTTSIAPPKVATSAARRSPVAPASHSAFQAVLRATDHYTQEMQYVLAVYVVLGLWSRRRTRIALSETGAVGALAGFHLLLLIALYRLVGYIDSRHVMVLVALSLPWAAAGMAAVAGWLPAYAQKHFPRWLAPYAERSWATPAGLRTVLLVLLVLCLFPWAASPLHRNQESLLTAASWLRLNARPDDGILTNTRMILFYTGLPGRLARDEAALRRELEPGVTTARFLALDTHRFAPGAATENALKDSYETVPGFPIRTRDGFEFQLMRRR